MELKKFAVQLQGVWLRTTPDVASPLSKLWLFFFPINSNSVGKVIFKYTVYTAYFISSPAYN